MKQPDLSDAILAAKSLLGWKLVHVSPDGVTSGYIVETEAYSLEDPASHAYGGMRGRNAPMFEDAGTIYVYFTYGMHYCLNIVTGSVGNGQAVLIRALEPVEGLEVMKKRRGVQDIRLLTNGPARLTQAMGIGREQNGTLLTKTGVNIVPGIDPDEIIQTTRIGISKAADQPWRFYIADNPFVSKRS